jgi:hypothetical protein
MTIFKVLIESQIFSYSIFAVYVTMVTLHT